MSLIRIIFCSLLPLAAVACSSSDDDTDTSQKPSTTDGPGSNEPLTNTVPAACQSDADCPDGITCIGTETGGGHCDVDEQGGSTSAPAPAPCAADTDCPDGVACVDGYCDVAEHVGPTSAPAPAPCTTDADCPAGVSCTSFGSGPGFCDVAEHTAN